MITFNSDVTAAAAKVGLPKQTFSRWMHRFGGHAVVRIEWNSDGGDEAGDA